MTMSEWKNKLESLEELRSEPLNKNQAWNKLYTRLENKPRREKRWIYWTAAACLVIVFFLLKLSNTNDIELNGGEISVKPNQPVPEIVKERKPTNPAIQEIAESTGGNKPVQVAKKKLRSHPSNTHPIEETVITVTQEDTVRNEQILVKVEPEQKEPAETQKPTAKKTLRVVHINELGHQVREDVIVAQRQRSGSIYLKIGNSSNTFSNELGSLPPATGNSRIVFNPTN
jgi:hypothetical protein